MIISHFRVYEIVPLLRHCVSIPAAPPPRNPPLLPGLDFWTEFCGIAVCICTSEGAV